MLIKIYPENQNPRLIDTITDCLKNGGVIIYPTDTVYAIGCDIHNHKALERLAQIKGIKPDKANFSLVCYDLSELSTYTRPIENEIFKLMKRLLPGPYTFILNASNAVPKIFQSKKKTVGIRIPDNEIIRNIIKEFGGPVASTSIHDDDDVIEYTTDPELIYEKYQSLVDIVIDGGYGGNEASTILDCTSGEIEVIREGKGSIDI
ncbi:MAG: L-threonylcarbamoyladenylate synthase [Bacteroidales bacterium]|nr:L-threonylcarbamoyladenylate synthase [Bacteroidales bacterium]